MTLAQQQGLNNVLGLTGFILILVGALLALVEALQVLRFDRGAMEAFVVLLMAGVAAVGAVFTWRQSTDTGGVLAIAAGVVFLVLYPATAGLLCLIGGILAIVSRRLTTTFV